MAQATPARNDSAQEFQLDAYAAAKTALVSGRAQLDGTLLTGGRSRSTGASRNQTRNEMPDVKSDIQAHRPTIAMNVGDFERASQPDNHGF